MKDPIIVDGFTASFTQESMKLRYRFRNVFPPLNPFSPIGDITGPVGPDDNFLVLVFELCSVNKEAKFSCNNSGVFSEFCIIEFETLDLGAVEFLSSVGLGNVGDDCVGAANKFIM